MRIAIFSDTFFPQINGVAYLAYQSAEYLSAQGHEVLVVTAMTKENKDRLKGKHKFQIIFSKSMPSGVYPGERVALPLDPAVLMKVKKFKPEIIHSHTPFSVGWSAVFIAKLLGVKLVGTHHTFFDHYLKHIKMDHAVGKKLSWKYTVLYYNLCDLVLCPSKILADELVQHGLYAHKAKVFANAIDTNFFIPVSVQDKLKLKNKLGIDGLTLIYVGRLSYEKSVDELLKVFSRVYKKNSQINFLVVGDGPDKIKLELLAKELGVEQRIKFTGFLRGQDWLEAFQSADLFITASESENMPMTILEAMSTGLPVVAVKEKGVPEIVMDGVNGFLIKAGEHDEFAHKIMEMILNPELLLSASLASRERSLDYSYEHIGDLLTGVYLDLINSSVNSLQAK